MRRKCTFSKNMEKTFCLPYWVQMLGLNYFTMQTFFHILAVVISIFIPLVSIILWESKTHALRSLDSSSSNVNKKKKMHREAYGSGSKNNRDAMGKNHGDMEAGWERGSKVHSGFHAFHLQAIRLDEQLPPADCHQECNFFLPRWRMLAYSGAPGLLHWRGMGELGVCSIYGDWHLLSGGMGLSGWTFGLYRRTGYLTEREVS